MYLQWPLMKRMPQVGQYRTKPPKLGEGVETGWRASLVDEGTVRLSSKGESDRITQRSAVQINPRNHERHCQKQWRSPLQGFRCLEAILKLPRSPFLASHQTCWVRKRKRFPLPILILEWVPPRWSVIA